MSDDLASTGQPAAGPAAEAVSSSDTAPQTTPQPQMMRSPQSAGASDNGAERAAASAPKPKKRAATSAPTPQGQAATSAPTPQGQAATSAPTPQGQAATPPEPPVTSAPAPVGSAEIEEEIPIFGAPAPAAPAPAITPAAPAITPVAPAAEVSVRQKAPSALYWGEQAKTAAEHEIPLASSPASSLYEAEIEIRHLSDHSSGQSAALGSMAAGALRLIGDNLRRMTEEQAERVTQMLHGIDLKDYLDPDFWKGIGMVLRYQADELVGFFQRRLSGQYSTDPYGMDRELIEAVRPFLQFMYRTWWRVTPEGLEHVPADGRGLLVANHSGVLPWDGAMIAAAVIEDHPAQNERILRSLHLNWFSSLPFVAPALAALGQVPGLPENAVRLLDADELVCVFPEGLKGVGKLYKDRYKLARFGRGGFVQAAIRTQSPIVPVAVVGAEEIYPMLANAEPVARLFGMPYFPLTPFFPWLGPLGVIPLPTRWSITFCEPLRTDMYDPAEADDPLTVLGLTEMVRGTIQDTIDARLASRKSVF